VYRIKKLAKGPKPNKQLYSHNSGGAAAGGDIVTITITIIGLILVYSIHVCLLLTEVCLATKCSQIKKA
jgi:hypothetical protein